MAYKEFRGSVKDICGKILKPLIVLINKTGVTPNFITWVGFFLNLPAVYFLINGKFVIAAVIIIVASVFDMFDGALARMMDKKTRFGGFLDSVIDRLAEGVLYFGILVYYIGTGNRYGIILSYTVMFFSILVSYLRARAGGLKINCEAGLFTRPERVIVLILGLLINRVFETLIVITVVTFITAVQRMWLVYTEAAKLDKNNS
jgi:CDP-diacylglycerol--glycerol-3-phosphate 3-phosphatidyltransferase